MNYHHHHDERQNTNVTQRKIKEIIEMCDGAPDNVVLAFLQIQEGMEKLSVMHGLLRSMQGYCASGCSDEDVTSILRQTAKECNAASDDFVLMAGAFRTLSSHMQQIADKLEGETEEGVCNE